MAKKKKNQNRKKDSPLEEKQKEETPQKKILLRENKQIIAILVIITLFFAAFIIPYIYVQNQKIFTYVGVEWQIEEYGEETLYHTRFDKIFAGKFYGKHNTFFRNDPRKNNIPVEIEKILISNNIIISQSPEILQCDKQVLVTDALSQIMLAIPFIKEKTIAITDKDLAEEINREYVTCDNKEAQPTLIQVELGDETKITENSENRCYFITVKSCEENIVGAERFILEVIEALNQKGEA